jgi:hypothetical protein
MVTKCFVLALVLGCSLIVQHYTTVGTFYAELKKAARAQK